MAADDLATRGARTSTAMVMTFFRNIPASELKGLKFWTSNTQVRFFAQESNRAIRYNSCLSKR